MNKHSSSDKATLLQQRIAVSYQMAELLQDGMNDALYCDTSCPEPDCENAKKSFSHNSMQAMMRNFAEDLLQSLSDHDFIPERHIGFAVAENHIVAREVQKTMTESAQENVQEFLIEYVEANDTADFEQIYAQELLYAISNYDVREYVVDTNEHDSEHHPSSEIDYGVLHDVSNLFPATIFLTAWLIEQQQFHNVLKSFVQMMENVRQEESPSEQIFTFSPMFLLLVMSTMYHVVHNHFQKPSAQHANWSEENLAQEFIALFTADRTVEHVYEVLTEDIEDTLKRI